jgi:hypothetical protein
MSDFSAADKSKGKYMETKVNGKATAERLNGGRFFRLMLREVKPEHVPDMLHMLWLFGHGGKKLTVPDEGKWLMEMPHDYLLVGEGRIGVRIEPARGLVAPRAINPYIGDHFKPSQPAVPVQKLDEHDTQGILALCEHARKTPRPERDRIIIQIFSLRLDRCRPNALDAVELLIFDLSANKTE